MASNNDMAMNLDEQYLIETNEQELIRYKKKTGKQVVFEVYPENLACVFSEINCLSNSGNRVDNLAKTAACIMGAIPWAQPFNDANRRTGIIAAGRFLEDNGYELDIDPEDENLELRGMLSEIKKQMLTLNQDILYQLSFYISKRIKPL